MSRETCATCRFFVNGYPGTCHRNAPIYVKQPTGSHAPREPRWPVVGSTDWCGEYKKNQ